MILRPSLTNEIDDALGIAGPSEPTLVILYPRYARPKKRRLLRWVMTCLVGVALLAAFVLASAAILLTASEPATVPF